MFKCLTVSGAGVDCQKVFSGCFFTGYNVHFFSKGVKQVSLFGNTGQQIKKFEQLTAMCQQTLLYKFLVYFSHGTKKFFFPKSSFKVSKNIFFS